MSKNQRESRKPALFNWNVATAAALGLPVTVHHARMERDEHGGYTFTDDKGVVADYPPGTVLSVTRADPAPTEADILAAGPRTEVARRALQRDKAERERRDMAAAK